MTLEEKEHMGNEMDLGKEIEKEEMGRRWGRREKKKEDIKWWKRETS